MRFFLATMEVGECSAVSGDDDDSASFVNTNDDDENNSHDCHVCDEEDEVVVQAGGTASTAGSTICLVEAVPDPYTVTSVAQSVDDDGNVHFISTTTNGTGVSPTRLQFVETAVSAANTSDDGSSGVVAPLKTTHIVIHKQALSESVSAGCSVKTPTTPLPPPTPATPRGRERGFRYQWDPSAFEPVLPVRCKNSSGELHKARFGSGRCDKKRSKQFLMICGLCCDTFYTHSVEFHFDLLVIMIVSVLFHDVK
jgi:hypothetical protein